MGHLLNFFEHLAIVLWMGSIVFFSFVAAPTVFRTLESEPASRLMRAIFPQYYMVGLCSSIVLALVQLGRGLLWYWGGMVLPSLILFALLSLATLYARQSLTPAISAARGAGPSAKPRLDILHRRSVVWNGVTLLLLFLYLIWMSTRGF